MNGVRALGFDVFGTVVDWRTSITREGEAFGRTHKLTVDWLKFAVAWRNLYQPMMNKVRNGEIGWTKLDDLHRMALDQLIEEFGIVGLGEKDIDHLNRAWHRLDPWPDSVRSEEHTSELQSRRDLVCRLLLEKKKFQV